MPVHPHIRGAYLLDGNTWKNGVGSSPHTWGIHRTRSAIVIDFRFIPTYVGHTNLSTSATTVDTVHPHIRGAYCNPLSANGLRCGSSPPTWGILDLHAAHAGERRFIPTYVGHTRAVNPVNIYCPVHPHIRGAYHRARNGVAHVARFIPTYVGYTFVAAPVFTAAAVHPHIRGVYADCVPITVSVGGSSPHTWGIPGRGSRLLANVRFIPTYVGHIIIHRGPIIGPPVHPHIRGAYAAGRGRFPAPPGSSPHTWGIHNRGVQNRA